MNTAWRLLIFDFDGVIADSMPGQERAWRAACERVGVAPMLETRLIKNLYDGHAGPRMFEGTGASDEIASRLRAAKDELWLPVRAETPLMVGAAKAIPALAGRYALVIATTADRDYVSAVLDRHQVGQHIQRIITDRDVSHPKPAPDMVIVAINDARASAAGTCVIGDSRTDYRMSEAAGVDFIHFASRRAADALPSATATSWRELAKMLLP